MMGHKRSRHGLFKKPRSDGKGFLRAWWVQYYPQPGIENRVITALHRARELVDRYGELEPITSWADAVEWKKRLDLIVLENRRDNIVLEPHCLKSCVEWYLNDFHGRKDTSLNTLRNYKITLKAFMRTVNSTTDVAKITPTHIHTYLDKLKANGLKSSTRERNRRVLRAFFSALKRKRKIIKNNPVMDVDPIKVKRDAQLVLTHEQVQAIRRHVPEPYRLFYDWLCYSGLRWSTGASVQWKNVNFELRQVYVYVSKNNEPLTIRMNDRMEVIFRRLWNGQDGEDLVFVNRWGRPLTHSCIFQNFKQAARKAGIPEFHPHTLRHTLGSHLGAHYSPWIVSQILGHKSIITTKTYVRPVEAEIRAAVDSIDWGEPREEESGRELII